MMEGTSTTSPTTEEDIETAPPITMEGMNTTKYQPTTTRMVDIDDDGDKDDSGDGFMQIVVIILVAVSLAISLAAIMAILLMMLQFYKFKKETKKLLSQPETYRNHDTTSVHTYEPMDGTVV